MSRLIDADGRKEWRAHWPVVVATMAGITISMIHFYSLGVMIAPLEQEFGWSRAQITAGFLLTSLVALPLSPVLGMAIDRFGPRRIAVFGVIMYCAAIAALSLAQEAIWTWWFLWLILAAAFLFIMPTVWMAALTSLFSASRGLAIAAALSAGGISSFACPIVTYF